MKFSHRLAVAVVLLLSAPIPAHAIERSKDGYFHTGEGVRVKKVAFVGVKVYAIEHAMKELPQDSSKQSVIDMDVDKKLAWTMLRTVDAEKIRNALREAYEKNGYRDAAKIAAFVGALDHELKEGSTVTIAYDAAAKTTTLSTSTGQRATVDGTPFMKATWSIWFGKIDQPALSDSLLMKIRKE